MSQAKVEFTKPNMGNPSDYGKIVIGGLGAGGATATVLTFITFTSTAVATNAAFWGGSVLAGFGITTVFGTPTTITTTTVTTTSLAVWLATTLGISTWLATGILTGGIGTVVGGVIYFSFYPIWRSRIRKKLLAEFDTKVLSTLRDWADDVISKSNS